jgi:DNA-binding HxlR family transcriptional regulator
VVFPTIPPKVEYSVTPLGLSFVRSLNVLVQWAAENREEVLAARMAYVPPTAEPAK